MTMTRLPSEQLSAVLEKIQYMQPSTKRPSSTVTSNGTIPDNVASRSPAFEPFNRVITPHNANRVPTPVTLVNTPFQPPQISETPPLPRNVASAASNNGPGADAATEVPDLFLLWSSLKTAGIVNEPAPAVVDPEAEEKKAADREEKAVLKSYEDAILSSNISFNPVELKMSVVYLLCRPIVQHDI